MGLASILSMLAQKNQISLETFLNLFQQLPEFGLASDSPAEEIERILRDKMLMSGPMAEQMAQALSLGYVMQILQDGAQTPEEQAAAQMFMQKVIASMQPAQPPPDGGPPGQPQLPPGMPPGMPGPGGIPQGNVMPGGGGPPPMPPMGPGGPQMPPGVMPPM
jgi:hypothetical protein